MQPDKSDRFRNWLDNILIRSGAPPALRFPPNTYSGSMPVVVNVLHDVTVPVAAETGVSLRSSGNWSSPDLAALGISGSNPNIGVVYLAMRAFVIQTPRLSFNGASATGWSPDSVRRALSSVFLAHKPQGGAFTRYDAISDFLRPGYLPMTAIGDASLASGAETAALYSGGVQGGAGYIPSYKGIIPVSFQNDSWEVYNQIASDGFPEATGQWRIQLQAIAVAVDQAEIDQRPTLALCNQVSEAMRGELLASRPAAFDWYNGNTGGGV